MPPQLAPPLALLRAADGRLSCGLVLLFCIVFAAALNLVFCFVFWANEDIYSRLRTSGRLFPSVLGFTRVIKNFTDLTHLSMYSHVLSTLAP
jgi:hypothetical protein